MRSRRLRSIAFSVIGLASAYAFAAAPPSKAVIQGKAVVLGKTVDLRHAWLVRAPNKFDKTKLSSVIVLSADDISAAIRKCPDRMCLTYEALKNGLLVEPSENGFWVFVANPNLPVDTQFSGPSAGDTGWKTSAKTADRFAGTLRYDDKDRKTSCDLTLDAPFLKEFPVQPAAR